MENNKKAILEEIRAEAKEVRRQFAEAKQKIENDPRWKECEDMVIIDWNDGREELLKNGVGVRDIFGGEEWVLERQESCLVRNFPKLTVPSAHLANCIFDHCGTITVEEGTATGCVFANVNTVFLDNVKVYDSIFRDMYCRNGGFIISLEDSSISGCKFWDIRLENGCCVGEGVGTCLVEKCRFKNVTTDRADGQLFRCEDTKGKLFKRRVVYDMVDRDTCIGIEG